MPRRFTEAEARRIFARAAEHQRADAPDDGLTLAELQEIGRAAGLSETAISAAVSDVRAGVPDDPVVTFLGVPSETRWSRVLPVEVTDAAWERMVAEIRRTFKQQGNPSQIGRVREWTGGFSSSGSDGLRVALEPTDRGTLVLVEQTLRSNVRGMRGVAMGGLGIGVLSALLPLLSGEAGLWLLPVMLLSVFALTVVASALVLRSMSNKTERNVDRLLDRFELIARDAAATSAATPCEPCIDAALLDVPAPADETPGRDARRARS